MTRGLLTLALAFTVAMPAGAQAPKPPAVDVSRLDYALQPRQIAPGVWVIEGAVEDFSRSNGCNIINTGFIVTGEGVVVINTGPSRLYGEQQRRAIERVTYEPVVKVLNLNLHPDYFFGNQAWAGQPVQALAGSMAGMQAEGQNYATNMYRLCGDWMKGTEPAPATQPILPQTLQVGSHRLELLRLEGHTGDDLLLIDHSAGVVFTGGLVFADRVPTTPHADVKKWLRSLDALDRLTASLPQALLVPSHGPIYSDRGGIGQTRDWLLWVSSLLEDSARRGLDLSEVLQTPVPERFAHWAAQPAEFQRTLVQWYPLYEKRILLGEAPAR